MLSETYPGDTLEGIQYFEIDFNHPCNIGVINLIEPVPAFEYNLGDPAETVQLDGLNNDNCKFTSSLSLADGSTTDLNGVTLTESVQEDTE